MPLLAGGEHFNCTIQELKLAKELFIHMQHCDFNCTIQELKLSYSKGKR